MSVAPVATDERIYVCARSYAQAYDYAKRQGFSHAQLRYIDGAQQLMGLARGTTIHLYGAWWQHVAEYQAIVRIINEREFETKVIE